ncbi:MAG: amylo-alpha-1,6-glucosidase [Candidatus Eisenbacteria bacterium]
MPEPIDIPRGLCADGPVATRLEWLGTNGIGGFASGTVAGVLTRRYHGLLVAALRPPLGRTVLVSKLDETIRYQDREIVLFADHRGKAGIEPAGFRRLDRFRLEGTIPVWTFNFSDAVLEKRVWMEPEENTTYVRYALLRAYEPVALSLDLLVNHRDYHGNTRAGDWPGLVIPVDGGLRFTPRDGAVPLYARSDRAAAEAAPEWNRGYFFAVEAYRGEDPVEDLYRAGVFRTQMLGGDSLTLSLSTEEESRPEGTAAIERRRAWERRALADADSLTGAAGGDRDGIERLVLAADQFVVRRTTKDDPEGRTVIAGYPWFTDWGRDTMIALPGLTLATGRPGVAASILRTFARHVDRGMIPNRFPDEGETPEYNTADGTLWFFEAVRAYHEATGDDDLVRELYPLLEQIVAWHERGTRHGIGVDPADGLLRAGEPGVQLTWMDAKAGDWVVTPRAGKPVEIEALWYNALRSMGAFASLLEMPAERYEAMALRAKRSAGRLWNAETRCCFDVLDGPEGDDPAIRPNQLFAVSLHHGLIDGARAKAVVDLCAKKLLTPRGLRTLDRADPSYAGRYGGDRIKRDGAYHQGTVWGWLIGPFASAHYRVYRNAGSARSFLRPFFGHLEDHGLGSVSEIFDGDPPHTPRGCFAQAWSVAEILRVWNETAQPDAV